MAIRTDRSSRVELTGTRIRDRRLLIGMKQSALAEAAGISPSYLNLIEHNRRRIGGKLLIGLARALGVEPGVLSDGADATIHDTLRAAADGLGDRARTAPRPTGSTTSRRGFPGWTGLIAQQRKRIGDLEAAVEGLRDRLAHDPVLAEAMHEVLSSAAAIRSTADILVREADLDPAWRGRFHRNLHEEAERLAGGPRRFWGISRRRTRAARRCRPRPSRRWRRCSTPTDTTSRRSRPRAAAIPGILGKSAGMEDAPAARWPNGCCAATPRTRRACRSTGCCRRRARRGSIPPRSCRWAAGTWRWCSGGWRTCRGVGARRFRPCGLRRVGRASVPAAAGLLLDPALRSGLSALAALRGAGAARAAGHGAAGDAERGRGSAPGRWRSPWRRRGSAARR
jgi:transcriptional regulator with XRE-family HTH domain